LAAAVLLLALGGAALGFFFYTQQQSVATVVSSDLRDGQKEVGLQPQLRLKATRPIATSALGGALRVIPRADAEVRAADGGRAFTWTPRQPLAELTRYTVTLASLRDSSGHQVKARSWHFTTTIVPRVVSLATEGGLAVPDQGEIPAGSRLRVGFNERMDQTSVRLLANGSPLGSSWSGDGRSVLLESSGLPIGRLELALAPGSLDSEGRAVVAWSSHALVTFRADIHTVPLRAPALVQVPNDPAARDQTGLQAADVVYEYLTEGDITRFTAVFTHAPDAVGPIRSGRLISFGLTRHLHGMLFMSGVSDGSGARLQADPVPSVIEVPGIFYRTEGRYPPNNLFIRAGSLEQNEERAGLPSFAPQHGPVPIADGDAAGSVPVDQHRSTYSYDGATGTYTKTQEGHQLSDAALQQPLHIQLLVVMHTTSRPTSYVEDVNGVHGLDFDTESGGRADFYYAGHHATGKWSAADRHSPFVYQLDSGAAVNLPLGLTWVDVVSG
jgi:DUF3048 family protein/Big-like domain-containing protein